jgi:WD40 repeat protein
VTFGADSTLAAGFAGIGRRGLLVAVGRIDLWDMRSERMTRSLEAGPDMLLTPLTTFSPDGERIAAGTVEPGPRLDGRVLIWEARRDVGPRTFGRGNRALLSMAFSPDGRTLATGWKDGRVRIWKTGS